MIEQAQPSDEVQITDAERAAIEVEAALGSIRSYARDHGLTAEQIKLIFEAGIAAATVMAESPPLPQSMRTPDPGPPPWPKIPS